MSPQEPRSPGGALPGADKDSREVPLVDLVPKDWLDAGTTSVWIRGYRAFRVDLEEIRRSAAVSERPRDTRIVVLWGQPAHPVPAKVTFVSETEWHVDASGEIKKAPAGAYVLLIVPYKVAARDGDEPETVRRLDAAAGALAAVCGRASVFERVFEYEFHIDGKLTHNSPSWENPLAFAPPRLDSRHAIVNSLLSRVANVAEEQRRKADLSLRWLETATYAGGGVDAFLKYWIALETLCMSSYGDFRPIVQSLARAYSISPIEAGSRFAVGRLFGLRGRILHEGIQPSIHGTLLTFMGALYGDVILEMFGIGSLRRAEEVLVGDPGFDLLGVLKSATTS